jgi:uncharacterized protein (DUF488 family)
MARVFTIGHSTHEPAAFLALLAEHGIRGIADVRRFPSSRRHPHVNTGEMGRWLGEAGVAYHHLEELGGRRRPVPGSPNGGWEVEAFRAYADHLATPEFARGMERLEALAGERATAVMCAEGPWWRCHRRLVADALLVRGHGVTHVLPEGRLAEHELPPFAEVREGELRYPPPQLEFPRVPGA